MEKDEMIDALAGEGLKVRTETRTAVDTGWRLHLDNGCIVTLYDSGRIAFHGAGAGEARAAVARGSRS